MAAIILKWIIVLLAAVNFGFMAFDGARALVTGDYIRPKTGSYAGQLGPWSKLVQKLGIDPMSAFMKVVFVLWGITGLILAACFALGKAWSWKWLLIVNICSLWYLFAGTFSSALQIVLLLISGG